MHPVLFCSSLGRVEVYVIVIARLGISYLRRLAVGGRSYFIVGADAVVAVAEFYGGGIYLGPVALIFLNFNGLGNLSPVNFGRGLYPLVFGALIVGIFKFTHPVFSRRRTAPIIHEHTACGRGHGTAFGRVHPVYGLAVNEPGDVVLRPAETVCMEILRSVETEVIHIFMSAHAVNIIIELHLGGIFTQELYIYLVPGIGLSGMRVGIITACASKEGACRAGLVGGLHADFIVAVTEILVSTHFTAVILGEGLFRAVGVIGYGEFGNAVFIGDVVCRPLDVEGAAVCPAVRFEHGGGLPFRPIGNRGCRIERFVGEVVRVPLGAAACKHERARRKRGRDCRCRQEIQ